MKSVKTQQNIKNRKSYRKIRGKLKKRIRNGACLDSDTIIKYNLSHVKPYIVFKLHGNLRKVKDWIKITVPDTLCIIEDHDSTMKFLYETEGILTTGKPFCLYIDHKNTKRIGLSASFLFDERLRNYLNYWKSKGYHLSIRGDISEVKEVNNFLLSFGFLKDLKIVENFDDEHVDIDYSKRFVTFKFHGSSSKVYLKSNASTELTEYFNKCFNFNGFELTASARGMLVDAISEIIGNAEEHNQEETTTWYALGCFNKDTNYCSFAIVNHGSTIYESLSDEESTSAEVLSEINETIKTKKSISENIADKFKSGHEESLWNVMALQDGISSKRSKTGRASSRGLGLMDVLGFIGDLKSREDVGQVAIISGKSKIVVDYTYPIIERLVGEDTVPRRMILFNKSGSWADAQDPQKVMLMKRELNGTMITGQFKINREYITNRMEKNDKDAKND